MPKLKEGSTGQRIRYGQTGTIPVPVDLKDFFAFHCGDVHELLVQMALDLGFWRRSFNNPSIELYYNLYCNFV